MTLPVDGDKVFLPCKILAYWFSKPHYGVGQPVVFLCVRYVILQAARKDIAMIKVVAPSMAQLVIDRTIQVILIDLQHNITCRD